MEIKTPSFWYRPASEKAEFVEKALVPLSALYRLAYEIHQFSGKQEKFGIPVLCIGNINAGGTGKTPAALALMDVIKNHGLAKNPFFMSRGYGGGEIGPLLVDPQIHNAWHTGDEPLVLAKHAPTIIATKRAQGLLLAMHRQSDLVLMDDGLQNPHIKKDIKFVVINGEMGFGNGRLLPAGPLREPLTKGLKKADAFILIGVDKKNVRALLPPGKPLFTAGLQAQENISPGRYLAFAGIGYPEKFFSFLRENQQVDLVETITYPDHYPYTEDDVFELQRKAAALDTVLLTTEKDYIRLPKLDGFAPQILRVKLQWDDEPALAAFLKSRIII
jgi:tetraacyldisaccharide 4'-kinase